MANDIDMWNDIEEWEEEPEDKKFETPNGTFTAKEIAEDLDECYYYAYNEYDEEKAEELKEAFETKYGFWGNYY